MSRTVRVINFPGVPVSVEVEGTESVREVFTKANIDFNGRELKLDGRVVNENESIGEGAMLIAMKKIKGNANLRVINFPGVPVNVEKDDNMTVGRAFDIAGIDYNGRELKLDGRVVTSGDLIGDGQMLIAMKKIKGNNELSEGMDVVEREKGLAQNVSNEYPTHAKIADIDGDNYQITLINDEDDYITMDFEEFYAIYDVKEAIKEVEEAQEVEEVIEVEPTVERPSEPAQEVDKTPELPVEEHHCQCDCVKSNAEAMLKDAQSKRTIYANMLAENDREIILLEKVLGLR